MNRVVTAVDAVNSPIASSPDEVVIGSGTGGANMARALAHDGVKVLLLERGEAVPREADNASVKEVFLKLKYLPYEQWFDRTGAPYRPRQWYNVGGATKFFGTVMTRFRACDFDAAENAEGPSPAWPFTYHDLEPWYQDAENLFGVHGNTAGDPTDPPRSGSLPYGALGNEPFVQRVTDRAARLGLHPCDLPAAVDLHEGGKCVRCASCDGFPCPFGAKNDAETRAVEPALNTGNLTLWTGAEARRLSVDWRTRRINAVEVEHRGTKKKILARLVVLSAGAVNSPLLLFRPAAFSMPKGLANSSDMVGRHYMTHNLTMIMAVGLRINPTRFQKIFSFNDWYQGDDSFPYPMGNVQTLGRLQPGMLVAGAKYLPHWVGRQLTRRSVDILKTTEDLPDIGNRVLLDGTKTRVLITPTKMNAHRKLNRRTRKLMRSIGLPLVLSRTTPPNETSVPLGTVRMGADPASAPLDGYGRSFDHTNLLVADGSILPSSAALNSALTIVAQSLRAADHILRVDFGLTTRRTFRTTPTHPTKAQRRRGREMP